ncbi:MAG: LuxR C-terminal-related transcriptional regulator [Rhodoferax sp.]
MNGRTVCDRVPRCRPRHGVGHRRADRGRQDLFGGRRCGPDAAGYRPSAELRDASGLRNRTIAEKLFVSETTVKAHLRSINVKLGAQSRTHAVAVARQRGWIA